MGSLWSISNEAKGLLGFVRDTGRKLEERLKTKFTKGESAISVNYFYDERSRTAGIDWSYKASQYDFKSDLLLKENDESGEIIIDGYPAVEVRSNDNWARPSASPDALRRAADICDDVTKFLEEEFGKSCTTRGNGCPIYKTKLSEKQVPQLVR